jgi:hypothetical protein
MKTYRSCVTLSALTAFSVGTLDECDAMMVLEFEPNLHELSSGVRSALPFVMNPAQARELGRALLLAADAVLMGRASTCTQS